MQQEIIAAGNLAVVITAQDNRFDARVYTNARNGIEGASATMIANSFKSAAGAKRWAAKKLAA